MVESVESIGGGVSDECESCNETLLDEEGEKESKEPQSDQPKCTCTCEKCLSGDHCGNPDGGCSVVKIVEPEVT